MNRLDGKVAIVTGTCRGIGHAIADALAREGAITVATGRSKTDEALGPRSAEVEYRQLDVASEEDWDSVVTETVERYGRIDVLVNNAGIIAYRGCTNSQCPSGIAWSPPTRPARGSGCAR